jgi:hypothetical protein
VPDKLTDLDIVFVQSEEAPLVISAEVNVYVYVFFSIKGKPSPTKEVLYF